MHHKEIKAIVRKQLKSQYPNWRKLTKKEKKSIAKSVLNEVISTYDFNEPVSIPFEELVGIQSQVNPQGIIKLDGMGRFIANNKRDKLISFDEKRRHSLLSEDQELKLLDELLDNDVLNSILSYEGYSPAMRDFFPSHFLRAELLKAIKYPEISYRKFCSKEYLGRNQKLNRLFIGLPLNTNRAIHHVQLSQFRSQLTFSQMINLMNYVLYLFQESAILGDQVIHCIDSTELAVDNQQLLASLQIRGKKIRIYDDIDCDCGKRRNKRDKSPYVVGYRMHTLTAIDAKTGHSYPLISLLAPANHHDSNFHSPLVQLAQAIGLDVKLVTADEAYSDSDGQFYKTTGTHLVTPPSAKVLTPENVNPETMEVMCDDHCEFPMEYVGIEDGEHEFKCGIDNGTCFRESVCPKYRSIPIDNGIFQRILYNKDDVAKAIEIRKNGERPFNLLKKREGLETVRVRSQHAILARCTFTTMATLLLEITQTRKKEKPKAKQRQIGIPFAMAS